MTAPLPWTLLHCRKCGRPVQVLFIPEQNIDPERFTCGACLRPKGAA